jgi:hypothetical protein
MNNDAFRAMVAAAQQAQEAAPPKKPRLSQQPHKAKHKKRRRPEEREERRDEPTKPSVSNKCVGPGASASGCKFVGCRFRDLAAERRAREQAEGSSAEARHYVPLAVLAPEVEAPSLPASSEDTGPKSVQTALGARLLPLVRAKASLSASAPGHSLKASLERVISTRSERFLPGRVTWVVDLGLDPSEPGFSEQVAVIERSAEDCLWADQGVTDHLEPSLLGRLSETFQAVSLGGAESLKRVLKKRRRQVVAELATAETDGMDDGDQEEEEEEEDIFADAGEYDFGEKPILGGGEDVDGLKKVAAAVATTGGEEEEDDDGLEGEVDLDAMADDGYGEMGLEGHAVMGATALSTIYETAWAKSGGKSDKPLTEKQLERRRATADKRRFENDLRKVDDIIERRRKGNEEGGPDAPRAKRAKQSDVADFF